MSTWDADYNNGVVQSTEDLYRDLNMKLRMSAPNVDAEVDKLLAGDHSNTEDDGVETADIETGSVDSVSVDSANIDADEVAITEEVSSTVVNVQNLHFADLVKFQQQLAEDFEVKLKYDAAKQVLIDKLYEENREFKEGILTKFRRQLLLAVIEQIDESEKSIRFFDSEENSEASEANYRKLLFFFREIVADFQNMLQEKFDVVAFRSEPFSMMDIKRQRPLRSTPTKDESLHRRVKQSLKPGYELGGEILRHEIVDVYTKYN